MLTGQKTRREVKKKMGLERKKDKIKEQLERQSLLHLAKATPFSSLWVAEGLLRPQTSKVTGDVTFTNVTISEG